MPAYEYQCQSCAARFERRQKMSDPEVELCPQCGGRVKRLISGGTGVISRGGRGSLRRARMRYGRTVLRHGRGLRRYVRVRKLNLPNFPRVSRSYPAFALSSPRDAALKRRRGEPQTRISLRRAVLERDLRSPAHTTTRARRICRCMRESQPF